MVVGLDLLVLIVGLLMFVLSGNPKLARIGEIMFASATLAILLGGDRVVALLGGR